MITITCDCCGREIELLEWGQYDILARNLRANNNYFQFCTICYDEFIKKLNVFEKDLQAKREKLILEMVHKMNEGEK